MTVGSPFAFAVRFLLGFALLFGAFEASRGTPFEQFVVEGLVLLPTTTLINAVTPNEQVHLEGRTLVSPGSKLHVTRGCEGIEMFLMLVAGILAVPATWKRRVEGLLLGTVLAFGLSVLRLMTLHYVLRYSPSAWEALHGLILPLAPIVLMALFFGWWMPAGAATLDRDTRAA